MALRNSCSFNLLIVKSLFFKLYYSNTNRNLYKQKFQTLTMTKSENKEETKKPNWIKLKPKEVESLVLEISKENPSPSHIGLILRDKHGIPKTKTITGKKILAILEENKIKAKSEKEFIQEKLNRIKKHFGKHKKDYTSSKALTKQLWALQKAK